MRQYECFELTFTGPEPEGSWAQAELRAEFVCEGKARKVDGFYAGSGLYKVRFYPDRAGVYSWKVTGAVAAEGEEICQAAASGPEDASARGIVRAAGRHFKYDGGGWYRPFGTTVYALIHQEKRLVDTTMETLGKAPFNKLRFCVFPKHYDFNHNEPPFFPFEKKEGGWDVHRPVFAYWEALEERIRELDAMGIQGDLILFHPYDRWGFSELGREDSLVYLDYLLRRLSAMPNLWWSLANEYDLMPNYNRQDWADFAGFVAGHDPYGHCLSNHNCMAYWDFSQKEITHCSIQDANVIETPELWERYGKPVVFDECRYEGDIVHSWGNLSGRELTRRFWTAVCCGGYCTHGETFYSTDQVLWWSRGGVLKGESPARIAFLRRIVESLPGPLDFLGDGLGVYTEGQLAAMQEQGAPEAFRKSFFLMAMLDLPRERVRSFLTKERVALGHCGQEAYLKYLERQCASLTELNLPQDGSYRVEVIDAWNMTREVVAQNVCGRVQIKLPGREDMAVLALRQ
ncbi:hypothetical protein IMSAGC003_03800 [Lachnospiraceae bacterium]|nr:DUF5060 domain-containing protein [Acetatifactor sp.]GFH97230.1 hypothetical protein IMSAGC003_03800 [Lachnospiraceae bacterium]